MICIKKGVCKINLSIDDKFCSHMYQNCRKFKLKIKVDTLLNPKTDVTVNIM